MPVRKRIFLRTVMELRVRKSQGVAIFFFFGKRFCPFRPFFRSLSSTFSAVLMINCLPCFAKRLCDYNYRKNHDGLGRIA